MTVNPTERQRLALTFRAPFEIEYEGDLDIGQDAAGMGAAFGLGTTPRSDFESEIEFPMVLALGYGIDRLPDLLMSEHAISRCRFGTVLCVIVGM